MPLRPDEIAALVKATNKKYDRQGRFISHSQILTSYMASKMIEMHSGFVNGLEHTFVIQNRVATTATPAKLFQPINLSAADNLVQGVVKLGGQLTHTTFDRREQIFNGQGTPEQIVDYVKIRLDNPYRDMYEIMEQKLWNAGDASVPDDILGIPHWIVMNTTEGFNGGFPTGYTTSAGLTAEQAPRNKNYTGTHANGSYEGLILPLARMARRTNFENIVSTPERALAPETKSYITTEAVIDQIDRIARGQNGNLGKDTGGFTMGAGDYMSTAMFKGAPFHYSPQLETLDGLEGRSNLATFNPIYQINWAVTGFIKQQECYMDMIEFPVANTPWGVGMALQAWWQMWCIDRRRNGVLRNPQAS